MGRFIRELTAATVVIFGIAVTPAAAQGLVEYALILIIAGEDVNRASISTQVAPRETNNGTVNCQPSKSRIELFEPEAEDSFAVGESDNQIHTEFDLASMLDPMPSGQVFSGQYLIAKVTHQFEPNELNRLRRKDCQPTASLRLEDVMISSYPTGGSRDPSTNSSGSLIVGPLDAQSPELDTQSPVFVSTIVGRPSCRLSSNGWNAAIAVRDKENDVVKRFSPSRADGLKRTNITGGFTVFTAELELEPGQDVSTVALPSTCADYAVSSRGIAISVSHVDFEEAGE